MLPCIFAGVMSLLAIVAAAIFLPESLSPEKQAANRAHHKSPERASTLDMLRENKLRLFTFQYMVHNACVSSATYVFPLWVASELDWSAREVGIVFGIQGMIMVLLQGGAMGSLVRALGEWRLLRISVSMFFAGMALAAVAWSMPTMVGSMFISMSGATMCMPLLNTILTQRTPGQFRGRLMGTTAAASSWGRVVGPFFSGIGLGLVGYSGTWAALAVLVLWYLVWVLRESSQSKDKHVIQET